MHKKVTIICGPTASGKSAYALKLAQKEGGVIINADSMQIHKYIPILTAQPSLDDMDLVPHTLYGFLDIGMGFSVGKWLKKAVREINKAINIGAVPMLVGGTGLYFKALIEGIAHVPQISEDTMKYVIDLSNTYRVEELHRMLDNVDEKLASSVKQEDMQRILRGLAVYHETGKPLSWWRQNRHMKFFDRGNFRIILVNPEREIIYENCNSRFIKMLQAGAVEEVRELIDKYPNVQYPAAIAMKEIILYLKGAISMDDMIKKAQQLTRNYAKRQMTWFKNQIHEYDEVITSLQSTLY